MTLVIVSETSTPTELREALTVFASKAARCQTLTDPGSAWSDVHRSIDEMLDWLVGR